MEISTSWLAQAPAGAPPSIMPPPSVEQLQQQVADLERALRTNRIIGAAIGIVMQRDRLDHAGAHAYLIGLSQNSNVKLSAVAAALVASTGGSPKAAG